MAVAVAAAISSGHTVGAIAADTMVAVTIGYTVAAVGPATTAGPTATAFATLAPGTTTAAIPMSGTGMSA